MIVEKIAKITETFLGFEDHGIFTAQLTVDYGGSGQGIGQHALDGYNKKTGKRYGTAATYAYIAGILSACGVDNWEKVKGRTILVLKESHDWNAEVVGLAPLPTEPGGAFLFAVWQAEARA